MSEQQRLAEQFEEHRAHLRSVAYRMLGSLAEAEDAVQEAWFRLSRSETSAVENLGGWLTTVVARVSLDMLRSRQSRREEPAEEAEVENRHGGADPEQEALLADSVGLALLVVLDTLEPAERLAFVLHDMFGVSFEEIARIVNRSSLAARQLASRARRRVQGKPAVTHRDVARQREIVDAFLAASRRGDFEGLLAVLDPNAVLRGAGGEVRGAAAIAAQAVKNGARAARAALVDGSIGLIIAPRGRLLMVVTFTIAEGRITAMDAIADRDRLARIPLAIL